MGQTEVEEAFNLFCPHFWWYSYYSSGVVISVYEMQRDAEGGFLSIYSLTDDNS